MESLTVREKPIHWVGSAKQDLLALPRTVVSDFGYALGVVQLGGKPRNAKPWKGVGAGVFELTEDSSGDTFRAVYCVRFAKAVYVLHCFQKKSPSGRRTAKLDIELIKARLKSAQADYEMNYGN